MSNLIQAYSYKYNIDYCNNYLRTTKDGDIRGFVRTVHGFVNIYSGYGQTTVEIMKDGYEISNTFDKAYSKQFCVTLAKRFAKGLFQ